MLQSLTAGASGVRTFSSAMTLTGANIANVNTTGYKTNRVSFQDALATQVSQTDKKIGVGVTLGNVQSINTQGSFESSELATDLAIEGDGFFFVKDQFGKEFFTRAGNFQYDKEGFLTTTHGMSVMVKDVNELNGETIGQAKKINILTQNLIPKSTGDAEVKGTGVIVKANINMNSSVIKKSLDKDDVNPSMYNFSHSVKVYDIAGNERNINVAFKKLEDTSAVTNPQTGQTTPAQKNRWSYYIVADRDDLENPEGTGLQQAVGGGFLQFDNVGKLLQVTKGEFKAGPSTVQGGPPGPISLQEIPFDLNNPRPSFAIDFKGTGAPMTIGFDFGEGSNPADLSDQRTGLEGVTQFAAANKAITFEADGNKAGELEDVRIDSDGTVSGLFDSGQVKALGRIQLANFKGAGNLERQGNNLYQESLDSGVAIINDPGSGGVGKVRSKALEGSNVDLATEFVKMIENQRAFQANAKTVTVSDEIIADLIQMKR